jgi:hypothetical protein
VNVPYRIVALAERFWAAAGTMGSLPRNLEQAVESSGLLSVLHRGHLSVDTVRRWLKKMGIAHPLNVADRPLRACLVACDGAGFAFIEANDSAEERRFSLAHELAHFLADYLAPREAVCRRIGMAAIDVLDGKRAATPEERVRAWCSRTDLGVHVHLMDRTVVRLAVRDAEENADRLAYELLAPATDVFSRATDAITATDVLIDVHRLSAMQAEHYASLLFPPPRMDPLLARLRLAPSETMS